MLRTKITIGFMAIFVLVGCGAGDSGAAGANAAQNPAENSAENSAKDAAEDAAASAANPPPAASAAAEPDERMVNAVKSRKAMLTVLKDNFVPLALMAGGRIEYDPDIAQRFADRLPVMIGMMAERFAIDTRGSGVETEALDRVWEDMDAFKGKISNALEASEKLASVASDPAQFKDAAMAMRSACGSCHDDFREEQD